MDPFTASVLSAAAGQLIADGVSRMHRVLGAEDHTRHPKAGAVLFDEAGDVAVILDDAQASTVNRVMTDARVRVLAESRALAPLGLDKGDVVLVTHAIAADFLAIAEAEGNSIDGSAWELIWRRFEAEMDGMYASPRFAVALRPEQQVDLQTAMTPLVIDNKQRAQVPIWLRDLADLAGDVEVLQRAQTVGNDICQAVAAEFEHLRFEHAVEDVRRPLRDLYVERNLVSSEGDSLKSADLFAGNGYARAVVTGAPGAGKTTLTQHVLHGAGVSGGDAIPLRVRAREINLDTPLLIDEIAAGIRRDFQLGGVTPEVVETLLTLGRAFVVFDGVDEVLLIPMRKKLIAKIETFSRRYPMSTILVTSRDVGYEQAAVDPSLFTRYRLLPFDEGQVREYANKWFRYSSNASDLVRSFLKDVEVVPDLRENPLMLSLLCTLYKARREIPRNRRQVYNQCADLLFKRWDSLRQIDQPVDHIEHGHDLIQDIALWFFKSENAQRGVEERQLQGVIAGYLQDTAGVLPADAKHRAKEFVEFCAGRAWLLGYSGSSAAGERLFVFTHRTFMEFFAAEGLARNSSSPEALAQIVCTAYRENASSVLPELIIAAAEASRRGAGRAVIEQVKKSEHLIGGRGNGRYLPLRVRLAAVLPLQPDIQDQIWTDALSYLSDEHALLRPAVFDAILELPRDPRARFLAHVLDPEAVGRLPDAPKQLGFQRALLDRWIARYMQGETKLYEIDWQNTIDRIWDQVSSAQAASKSDLLRLYALSHRREPLPLRPSDLALWIDGLGSEEFPGPLYKSIERAMAGKELDTVDSALLDACSKSLKPPIASPSAAYEIGLHFMRIERTFMLPREEISARVRDALLIPVLTALEGTKLRASERVRMGDLVGVDLDRLEVTRQDRAGFETEGRGYTPKELSTLCLPGWARRWAGADLFLVADPVRPYSP